MINAGILNDEHILLLTDIKLVHSVEVSLTNTNKRL